MMRKMVCRLTLYVLCFSLAFFSFGCEKSTTANYQIMFHSSPDEVASIIYVFAGEKIPQPADLVREGYTFLGWSTMGQMWDFSEDKVTSPMHLLAVWEAIEYPISYHYDGGDYIVGNPNSFTMDDMYVSITSPTREGYEFQGWHFEEDLSDPAFSSFEPVPAGVHLYASWTKKYFNVYLRYEFPELQKIEDIFVPYYVEYATDGYAFSIENKALSWNLAESGTLYGPNSIYVSSGLKFLTGQSGSYFGITNSNHVYSWGFNQFGQLGDGTTTGREPSFSQDIDFPSLGQDEKVVSIVTSGYHSFAFTNLNRIFTWGINQYGQLGDGTTTGRLSPVLINPSGLESGETIQKISAGGSHTLALTSNGRILGWGSNYDGCLGVSDGGTIENAITPIAVDDSMLFSDESFIDTFAGVCVSFAITSAGRLFFFGSNINNLSGRAYSFSDDHFDTPILVSIPGLHGGEKIVSVHASNRHVLALSSEGRVFSWGKTNSYGQLGNRQGSSPTPVYEPSLVSFSGIPYGEKIVTVRAYEDSSFAITDKGRVFAWGKNQQNQLGLKTKTNQFSPVLWSDVYITENASVDQNFRYGDQLDLFIPDLPAGMSFSGWFVDRALTIPYTQTIASEGYVILYGKVRKVQ